MHVLVKVFMLLAVVSMVSCVSNKKFQALEAENQELSQTLEEIQSQVADLQQQNTTLNDENGELNANLQQVEQQLNQTENRVTQVEREAAEKSKELDAMNRELKAAFAEISAAVNASDAKVKEMANALYLDLADTISFRTASAAVSAGDAEAIDRLAELLKQHPNLHLVIEGNSDKRGINNDEFADNWELSSQRSINVVRKLIAKGVNPEQLTAAGRAEYNPAVTADPDSRETLAKNRRIELMVVPDVRNTVQTGLPITPLLKTERQRLPREPLFFLLSIINWKAPFTKCVNDDA